MCKCVVQFYYRNHICSALTVQIGSNASDIGNAFAIVAFQDKCDRPGLSGADGGIATMRKMPPGGRVRRVQEPTSWSTLPRVKAWYPLRVSP